MLSEPLGLRVDLNPRNLSVFTRVFTPVDCRRARRSEREMRLPNLHSTRWRRVLGTSSHPTRESPSSRYAAIYLLDIYLLDK